MSSLACLQTFRYVDSTTIEFIINMVIHVYTSFIYSRVQTLHYTLSFLGFGISVQGIRIVTTHFFIYANISKIWKKLPMYLTLPRYLKHTYPNCAQVVISMQWLIWHKFVCRILAFAFAYQAFLRVEELVLSKGNSPSCSKITQVEQVAIQGTSVNLLVIY